MEGLYYIFVVVVLLSGLFLLAGLVLYVLMALGLSKIANKEGRGDIAWLAWIPLVNAFLITLLVEEDVEEHFGGKLTLAFGISLIASVFLAGVLPFVSFAPLGILLYAFYFITKRYSDKEEIHLVIAAFTGLASFGVQFYMFRDRDRLDEEGIEVVVDEEIVDEEIVDEKIVAEKIVVEEIVDEEVGGGADSVVEDEDIGDSDYR